jgi:hypothetical protein
MEAERKSDRYEFILGFLALIISLSAFKDELQRISFNLGNFSYTLGEYFLIVISGLLLCLYLYIIEKTSRNYSFGSWRLFSVIITTAEIIFIFLILSPVFLLFTHLAFWVYSKALEPPSETLKKVNAILQVIGFVLTLITTIISFINYNKRRRERKLKDLEEEEIKDLELSGKLLKDGYYSQSILESFKVLETHLHKKLTAQNIRSFRSQFSELVRLALDRKIISLEDVSIMNDIRGMRNSAAHLDVNFTKEQAELALNFIRELIRNSVLNPPPFE